MLNKEALAKLSDKAQYHYIRLRYHIKKVKSLWWWERWLKTTKCKDVVSGLGEVLREVSQYLEHVELEPCLKNYWDYALQVYTKGGGK